MLWKRLQTYGLNGVPKWWVKGALPSLHELNECLRAAMCVWNVWCNVWFKCLFFWTFKYTWTSRCFWTWDLNFGLRVASQLPARSVTVCLLSHTGVCVCLSATMDLELALTHAEMESSTIEPNYQPNRRLFEPEQAVGCYAPLLLIIPASWWQVVHFDRPFCLLGRTVLSVRWLVVEGFTALKLTSIYSVTRFMGHWGV